MHECMILSEEDTDSPQPSLKLKLVLICVAESTGASIVVSFSKTQHSFLARVQVYVSDTLATQSMPYTANMKNLMLKVTNCMSTFYILPRFSNLNCW